MKLDLRNILSIPYMYSLYQNLIGDNKLRSIYSKEYIKAKLSDRILDIGCGPGNMISYLPDNINYIGFDTCQEYIESAKKIYKKDNYSFFCKMITEKLEFEEKFDIIMANGVLHHLNDEEVLSLFKLASNLLKLGGRLVTYDGCYIEKQSLATKFLLKMDRGKYVRAKEEYFKLASSYFDNIEITIKEDLYKIPYTIIFMVCTKRI